MKDALNPLSAISMSRSLYSQSITVLSVFIVTTTGLTRSADLSNYEFDKSKLKFISPKDASTEQASSKVQANDVLISRSGTLGLTVPIPKEFDGSGLEVILFG